MIRLDNIYYDEYLVALKSKLFKILPLFEEKNTGIFQYICSLINELHGFQYLVVNKSDLVTIIATLESLLDEQIAPEYDIQFIKSEVFKCISLTKKLSTKGE